jgi:Protein of unknown function (DUF551)
MNMDTAPKITREIWNTASCTIGGGSSSWKICNKAIEIALADQHQIEANRDIANAEAELNDYITAAQARELGAGNFEVLCEDGKWQTGTQDCPYREMWQGEVIKYRAIKQSQPEPVGPHADLRAEYANHSAPFTPITADDVTDEMVTMYRHRINSNSHDEQFDCSRCRCIHVSKEMRSPEQIAVLYDLFNQINERLSIINETPDAYFLCQCVEILKQQGQTIDTQAAKITELESQVEALRKDATWIAVSERLPDDNAIYLAYFVRKDTGLSYIGKSMLRPALNAFYVAHDLNDAPMETVTHWKPLPPPPAIKGEQA